MSKTIQNYLIEAVATTIEENTTNEIDAAPFSARQIDEAIDISCKA